MKVNITKEGNDEITIDSWDMISMHTTLAQIIHPMLVKQKEIAGIPFVSNTDVPKHLRSTDDYCLVKWQWVIDEMIYAFGRCKDDLYGEDAREENGLRLFGIYYRSLWH